MTGGRLHPDARIRSRFAPFWKGAAPGWRRGMLLCLIGAVGLAAAPKVEITVHGQHAFSAHHIEALLALPDQRPDWHFDDWNDWAQDGAAAVADAYRDQGYFNIRVGVHVPPEDSLNKPILRVAVTLNEGERFRFGSVDIHLPAGNFPAYRLDRLRCRPGKPFEKDDLFRDQRDLLQFYGNEGFLKATAAESLYYDTTGRQVAVSFQVQPGQALVFDTLILRVTREGDSSGLPGLSNTRLLRSLFRFHRGDTLPLNDMNTFERKLKSTRVFNFVRVRDSLLPGAGGRSALILNAEEKVPGDLSYSGFWENLYGFGVEVDWSHANMGGLLHEGNVGVIIAQRKQSFTLGYASPLLFGSLVRFDNDFSMDWYQDQLPIQNLPWFQGDFDVSNESNLSRQLLSWLRFVTGAELLGSSQLQDSTQRVRGFNLNYLNSVYLEKLDNIVNPTRGARLALTWGNGGPVFQGGDISAFESRHNWFESQSALFLPASQFLVLALRFDGGRFFGAGGINSERFFLGGPRSVRSKDWREVCPEVDSTGACAIEGVEPAYILGSAELRFQPFQPSWISPDGKLRSLLGLQIVPFCDYGNVWEIGKNLTAAGTGRAVGVGLRYLFLSLFNIRVDYARDPRHSGPDSYRWILDLAQAF